MPESFRKHRNASSVEFLETMLIIRILNFCSSLHRLHKCYKLHYLTGKHGILFWTLFLRDRELSWAATTMSVGIISIQSRVLQNNILTEFFRRTSRWHRALQRIYYLWHNANVHNIFVLNLKRYLEQKGPTSSFLTILDVNQTCNNNNKANLAS